MVPKEPEEPKPSKALTEKLSPTKSEKWASEKDKEAEKSEKTVDEIVEEYLDDNSKI